MKQILTTILTGALLSGAVTIARADHAVAREQVRPGVEPRIFDVDQHDGAMKRAVHQARRTVGVMMQAVLHPKEGQHDFEVKKPFRQDGVVEHLWLSDVTFNGNRFHGFVDNKPRSIKGLKMGDRVSVNPDEISDWAFVENGRLVGGYTIRVLFSELSPTDKLAFVKEAKFHIVSQ